MTIEIVKGCLLDAFDKGDVDVIVHCVNCKGVMGGLAGKIKQRYPSVYTEYLEFIQKASTGYYGLLGKAQLVEIGEDESHEYGKTVVNVFGQLDYGTHKRQVNYGALGQAFTSVACGLTANSENVIMDYRTIGFPYLFASNLAGGDWNIVLEMIEFHFRNHNVKIYQL